VLRLAEALRSEKRVNSVRGSPVSRKRRVSPMPFWCPPPELIIDDPINPADAESETERRRVNEWYDKTLYSRLDDKEAGAIIVVMQRLHENDLTGYLLEKGEFEILALPAIAIAQQSLPTGQGRFHLRSPGEPLHPAREDLVTLERIKSSVGSRVFEAQYQQSPVPAEGNLFKAAWLRRYSGDPRREIFNDVVQSWDTGTKLGGTNDYSVCTTWGISLNRHSPNSRRFRGPIAPLNGLGNGKSHSLRARGHRSRRLMAPRRRNALIGLHRDAPLLS